MDRNGYFTKETLRQDAIRIFELAEYISHGINVFDEPNQMEMALRTATAIYTARMQIEHPEFDDTEVKQ